MQSGFFKIPTIVQLCFSQTLFTGQIVWRSSFFLSAPIVQQTQVADPEESPEFNNQSSVFVMARCNSSRAADVQEVGGPGLLPTEQESKVNGNKSGVSYRVSLQSSSEFPLFSHPVRLYQFSCFFRHATGVLVTPY